ncbi:MAG: alpha-ketoglutarate-dependent taurine dioxygenase [Parasphingorhabdus sp.]|jgi:alpha-ketoglutarate-dependent taurine dioxygenase
MVVRYLDCSNEVSELRDPPAGVRCWVADEIVDQDWKVFLSSEALLELESLALFIEQNPLQNLQRRVSEVSLPACELLMAQMKEILSNGVGFAVLDRLPMQAPIQTLVEVYWLLGQCIGRPVAQKWNGEMIYDVTDTGKKFQYGVRGSRTSVELLFHTDNAFAQQVPDYVGLFCRNPARQGGISRFCSLYTVHQRMRATYPELLMRLYQSMFFDRQKEHREGGEPVCFAPYFSWRHERLYARANSSLARKGYEVAEVTIDAQLSDALDAIDEVCAADDLWFEAELERGQIQYLNNHEVGHYRSAFEDFDEPEQKRYLYRLWHREEGSIAYDGLYMNS